MLRKAIKKRKMKKQKQKFFKRNGGLLLQQQLLAKDGTIEKAKIFTASELDKATDHFNANRIVGRVDDDEDRSLVTRFLLCMEEKSLWEILDVKVSEQGKKEDVIAVAWLAQRCLNYNGKKRPTMKEVAAELDAIRASNPHLASTMEILENESAELLCDEQQILGGNLLQLAEFGNVVDVSLKTVVDAMVEDIRVQCGETNLMVGMPLAKLLPRLAHLGQQLLEEPNRNSNSFAPFDLHYLDLICTGNSAE
nr:wall-associated receptor kinase-like 1 [Ipomoea batatas]